jgi:tRNA threonylcarbamoyladenosine biosynthesis protein TsaE
MFEIEDIRLSQLETAAHKMLDTFPEHRIFAFYGGMGAGKTTFIHALCQALGSTDYVTSPSFAIINEYSIPAGDVIYHFDFYRIKNLEEAFDLGYEDYFYSGQYCLIEWPEKIESLLPEQYIEVTIEVTSDDSRSIRANPVG